MKDNQPKRTAIFAHFDKNNIIDDYVIYYLKRLKDAVGHIVFVTTSDLPGTEIGKIETLCKKVIKRENRGYDFMSYKIGIESIEINDYGEIVICNDSVYGPFFGLAEIFDKMRRNNCDFWGVTDSREERYHIQSYFVVFKDRVIKSRYFKEFWKDVSAEDNKDEIIRKREIGLSQILIDNGFRAAAYIAHQPKFLETYKPILFNMPLPAATRNLIKTVRYGNKLNPTHLSWRQMIEKDRMPFLKIELLRDNPLNMDIKDFEAAIRNVSDYDTSVIRGHLMRVNKV